MKNQYVGDIGDFGKYALLKAFDDAGVKVGINWYLTENDRSNDGKFTSYLKKDDLRWYCPEVFDFLKQIAEKEDKTVVDVQNGGILPGAIYYPRLLNPEGTPNERKKQRNIWFQESLQELADAELVFMDPDNGLLERGDAGKREAEKYILPSEVENLFNRGHNVIYYCHKGRRTYDQWDDYKSIMFNQVKDALPAVLTYHKGSQRSYIFLIHEKDFIKYRKIIDHFLGRWYRVFSEEYTSVGDPAGQVLEEAFAVQKADGTKIAIEKRADGRIQMRSSRENGALHIVDADYFCHMIGF